jgi:aspartate oxidase
MEDYQRLLHIVIVGGGPTGVEVAGELADLINSDLKSKYPDRARAMRWAQGPGLAWCGALAPGVVRLHLVQ